MKIHLSQGEIHIDYDIASKTETMVDGLAKVKSITVHERSLFEIDFNKNFDMNNLLKQIPRESMVQFLLGNNNEEESPF